ncbi:MAG: 3'-5' exonuclease, partial [Pseudomonadales bacterium]|nr:3'-5' exonuclease [Pseudomonadales bacterium]
MVHGFILTRQWTETAEGQSLVFWAATCEGPVRITMEDQESIFFLPDNLILRAENILKGVVSWRHQLIKLKDFQGTPVHACYFRNQRDLNVARSKLSAKQIAALEADVRPTDRFLMERFINGALSITGTSIEEGVDSPTGVRAYQSFLDPHLAPVNFTPTLKIASLDIETSYSENVLYSIAVAGQGFQAVFMIGDDIAGQPEYLEFLVDERALIRRFLSWFADVDPDVIIGWSVVAFDLQFLEKRCQALNIDFRLGRGGETVRWRTNQQRQDRKYALVPGRVVLDGIEMLRTATWSFESFALDFVARELLGRGKLVDNVESRASEIQDMFREDKLKLAAYNLEDCQLVVEIFESTELMAFSLERGRLTGLELDRPGGSVAAFDYLYLPRLHRKGFVAPVADLEQSISSPGGYVL